MRIVTLQFLLPMILLFFTTATAQPFRYIQFNSDQRDSIRALHIRGYKEFTATFTEPEKRILTHVVEYDTNGNTIRELRIDLETGKMNQRLSRYSSTSQLLELSTFFPDTLTLTQHFTHAYDERGNEIETTAANYSNGVLSSSSRTIYCYDQNNNLVEIRSYNQIGKEVYHYEYLYNASGRKTEKLVFNDQGKLIYRRPVELYDYEEREPYGLPVDIDPEIEALQKVVRKYHADGGYSDENGYYIRTYSKENILVYWYYKHFRYHWYTYSYYTN